VACPDRQEEEPTKWVTIERVDDAVADRRARLQNPDSAHHYDDYVKGV
jgi:hypothetical protein